MNIFSVVEKNSNHFSAFLSIWKSLQSQECKNKEFEVREGLLSGVLWKGGSMGLLCEA